MASPSELVTDEHGLDTCAFGRFKDAGVGAPVFPTDAQESPQATKVIFFQNFKVTPVWSPSF